MMLPHPMIPWLETVGAILLALVGVGLGMACARLPGRWWTVGYFMPLTVVIFMGLPNWFPEMLFIPPSSWLTAGRNEYVFAAILATWLLTTPLSRLPRKETRRLIVVFMIATVLCSSIMAFLAPALIRNYLLSLKTEIDKNGVCHQSTGYNCGPASAVTALRRLGLKADEGELAVLAHTSPFTGTPPDILADTLATQYGPDGLTAKYRFFREVKDLKGVGEVLAVIELGLLVNHYVAVLEVTDTDITVGDPLTGREILSHQEFKKKWLSSGIVLNRKPPVPRTP